MRDKPLSQLWWKRGIVCALVLFVLGNAYLGAERLQRVEVRLSTGRSCAGSWLQAPARKEERVVSPAKNEIVTVPDTKPITIRESSEPGQFEDFSLWDVLGGRSARNP
jgi:hypothetical protein